MKKQFIYKHRVLWISIILSALIILFMGSCSRNISGNTICITQNDSANGHPTYTVKLPNGKVIDYMYAEEISKGLSTGKWEYDEDLTLNIRKTPHYRDYIIEVDGTDSTLYYSLYDFQHELIKDSIKSIDFDSLIIADNL